MLDPMDKEAAFASIAADLETFVPLLATTDRAAQLAAVRNIDDVLLAANLTWRDVAERLAAPRTPASGAESSLTAPPPYFGRHGYGPVPDTHEVVPGESVEAAGQRLANWSIVRSGQPLWEDPATGMGYLPGVTVPGKGKVQPDGRLGPLPADE